MADLPSLARTLVGLAILSGLRRGEIFALRWKDIDEQARARWGGAGAVEKLGGELFTIVH